MSVDRDTGDLRPRLRVLDELRACDRVIAGALATITNADADEPRTGDDETPDLHRAEREADRAAAAREVMRAFEHLRRAVWLFDEVRGEWAQPSARLRQFARMVSATGVAEQLHKEVRTWFEALRRSDPRLASVAPLMDWTADEPLAPVEMDAQSEDVQLAEMDHESTALARPRSYDFAITVVVGTAALFVLQTLLERCWYGF